MSLGTLKKDYHTNKKGAAVDKTEHAEYEDLPLDKLVCLFASEHNGAKGFVCRLTDKTEMFLPTPRESDKDEMWDELNEALAGSPDFVLYLDAIIRVNLLRFAEIVTVGVQNPTLVFHFEDAFDFHLPYENLELLQSHHARLTQILSGLQDYRSQVAVKHIVH